jgi:serine/threonine protein kinase
MNNSEPQNRPPEPSLLCPVEIKTREIETQTESLYDQRCASCESSFAAGWEKLYSKMLQVRNFSKRSHQESIIESPKTRENL